MGNENLIIPEMLAQYFGFTGVLEKQARSYETNFLVRCWSQKTSQTQALLNSST